MKTWLVSRSLLFWIGSLAAAAVVVVAAAAVLIVSRAPTLDEIVDAERPPVLIQFRAPTPPASYPPGAAVPVSAEVWSEVPLQSVELWDGGTLVGALSPAGGNENPSIVEWTWTPLQEGDHTLAVKATTHTGESAYSPALTVHVTAPVGAQLLLPVEPGEDPAQAAAAAGLDPAAARLVEPPEGSSLPAYLAVEVPPYVPSGPAPAPAAIGAGLETAPARSISRAGEVALWLRSRIGENLQLPEPPLLSARAEGCDIVLSFLAGANTDGVIIYRLDGGAAPPDRVAFAYADPGVLHELRFEKRYGSFTYYAAAIAPGWEVPGDPVSVEVNDPSCAPPESGGMRIENGKLIVPGNPGRIYLYFGRPGITWGRYPTEPGIFLSSRANSFDIAALLHPLSMITAEETWTLVVWGWQAVGPVELGRLEYTGGATEVYVCSHAGPCTEGLGWTTQSLLPDEETDRVRQFQWSSTASSITGGIWQLSALPFSDTADLAPDGLIASGDAGAFAGVGAQSFWIDFSSLELPGGGVVNGTPQVQAEQPWLLADLQRVPASRIRWTDPTSGQVPLYVRVLPMSGDALAGEPSPPAIVYLGPAQEQTNPYVPPPEKLPDIYTVHIDSFQTISGPYLPWGCVQIQSIDENQYPKDPYNQALLPGLREAMTSGSAYCPAVYKGEGSPGPLESFLDFAGSGLSWISEFYEDIKNEVVDIIGEVINTAIPGLCEGSVEEGSTCHKLLKQGLEAGLTALGIPPELPNVEKLIKDGRAYLVAELAEELGPECGEYCQQKLDEALDEVMQQLNQAHLDQACGDVELAHSHGSEPLCLPAGVKAVPHPGSYWQPANVTLTISRPAGGAEVAPEDLSSYRLNLTLYGVNNSLVGESVPVDIGICERDGQVFQCGPFVFLHFDQAPAHDLFTGALITIPPLPPGGSITIPFNVLPVEYYFPGHLEAAEAIGGGVLYDDWWKFYYNADLTITAVIECPDIKYLGDYLPWQVCGQGDEYQETMPNTMWP